MPASWAAQHTTVCLDTHCTRWGCEHENTAYLTYKEASAKKHEDLEIREAGLFVDLYVPYLGVSPDGIIH